MKRNCVGVFTNLLFVVLMACVMSVSPALGQVYFHDDFNSSASLNNYEIGGLATWQVENGELVTRDAGGNWNCIVLKEALWEGWTDYTYELKVTPESVKIVDGVSEPRSGNTVIYQVFRYSQPVSANRVSFMSYMMEMNVGIYIDRFVDAVRTKPVPDTKTFDGTWQNDKEHVFKLVLTSETIAGYVDAGAGMEKQFEIPETNLIDGRIGMAAWNGSARFDDLIVYGPDGPGGAAVEPAEKAAVTWGRIKGL